MWKKVKKYFEYAYTKVSILGRQKSFQSGNVHLKYIFHRNDESKDLVIVFSACTRNGVKARYNYMRTLQDIHTNKLFILDDFSPDKRGCYYLGEYPDFEVESAVTELIQWVCGKISPRKIVMCGSSKGGYAALNFGMENYQIPVTMIVGAPQYHLGEYLKSFPVLFPYIKGVHEADEVISELNVHLANKLSETDGAKKEVYLHYSYKERTYQEHVADFIADLRKLGIRMYMDERDYEAHSSISLYFPDYLKTTLRKVLES